MGFEDIENSKIPEIHSEELLNTIENVKWENGEWLEYNRLNYLLFLTDKGGDTVVGPDVDAFFTTSSIANFDIYIVESLPLQERKRMLFHELLEADLAAQGFKEEEAHAYALNEEEKVFGKRDEE